MQLKPRKRDEGILTKSVVVTVGFVGVFMALSLLAFIRIGVNNYGSVVIGSTLALSAFAMFRIVGSYESRSETLSCFSIATFDNRTLNTVVVFQLAAAYLATEWDVLRRLLGTEALTGTQWLLVFGPALVLLLAWEAGKAIARSRQHSANHEAHAAR
jgi:Ca2+-transporting ATPase